MNCDVSFFDSHVDWQIFWVYYLANISGSTKLMNFPSSKKTKKGFLENWTILQDVQVPLANELVVKFAKTNNVQLYALRLGSRVEALTTAQQQ